jgi:hypothetical protein
VQRHPWATRIGYENRRHTFPRNDLRNAVTQTDTRHSLVETAA